MEKPKKNETTGQLLQELQKFLHHYCLFGTRHKHTLAENTDLIIQRAVYVDCPQQTNLHDCGLFALGTLLHLLHGYCTLDLGDAFKPSHITSLRMGLYEKLTSKSEISYEFLSSFFPRLSNSVLAPLEETQTQNELDKPVSVQPNHTVKTLVYDVESTTSTTPLGQKRDDIFCTLFLDSKKTYESLAQLDRDVDFYERTEGVRLIIRNSDAFSRIYVCGSHIKCCFRAKFGKVPKTDLIALKDTWTHPYHSGEAAPPMAKGRAYKKRLKGRIEESIDHAHNTKHSRPGAKDIVVTAGNYHSLETTYKQAHRAMEGVLRKKLEDDVSSFQLIVPYLQKFRDLNDGATVEHEVDEDGRVQRLFVCPAFMNSAIRHARPVMSLDAAHLKSKWKGTLYVASVKTACDEIFPVAMAIMCENENEEGWTWFLRLLLSACEFLVVDHPKAAIDYKYYMFISDRQKGLINALRNVFPHNHATFCSSHIARNVEKLAGKRVASMVYSLSKTSSHLVAGEVLENIGKLSERAKEYLEEIQDNEWRGTAWLDDMSLPTRYGICTSNMSESTNNMFEKARDKSWLHSMDTMLSTMMKRIATLREKHKDKEGVVHGVKSLLHDRWERVIGYEVFQLTASSDEFTVVRKRSGASDSFTQYTINVVLRICECGEWQEYGFPCVDAMAYLRLHRGLPFYQVLTAYVDAVHTYEAEREMLSNNIFPVCMATIARDGKTLPPRQGKRQSGRPRKKRLRKRSRWAHEPEKSNVVCSRCLQRGHNIRTCVE